MIESSNRSIIREDIQTVEEQVGHNFPSSYKDFLATYGGFGFENYVDFPFLDPYPGDDRGLITIFFEVMSGDTYDLMNNYRSYRSRMPSGFLPIASDPGGNVICLSLREDDQGCVYFWDHEDEEMTSEGEEPGRSNVYLLGKSFDDFISSLEVSEDEDDEE